MVEYVVVEQTCEFCGEINAHLTIDCPHQHCERWSWRSFESFLAFVSSRMDTLMFFAGQVAR